jgi:DNA-directed RNA polymerase I, II, and III subunit RPABC1
MSDSEDDNNNMNEEGEDEEVAMVEGEDEDDHEMIQNNNNENDDDDDDDDDDEQPIRSNNNNNKGSSATTSSLVQSTSEIIPEPDISNTISANEAIAAPCIRGGLNPAAARLFRVYRTIANMLEKRGYMVPKALRDITPMEFKAKFGEYPARDNLTILVEKADDENAQLFVFFPEDEKVGVKPIKVYTDRMQAEGVTSAIIILRVDITPFAKQAVQEMSEQFRIEHFKETELLIDITKHQLVPVHQVLTSNEKLELLKRYRLRDTQLPRIQPNDPIARFYGMKRGNVVKIIRPSETAGRYVTYRVCM